MKNRKFWMIFILILVFIVGMIAGVLLDENITDVSVPTLESGT